MTKRTTIIAGVIGVVFLFAGYNLYSYFQTQAEIAAEEERLAEERRIEREQQRAEREAARQAEEAAAEARREAERQAAEARRAEREAEQARAAAEAEAAEAARQAEREQERAERQAADRAEAIARVRHVERVPGFTESFRRELGELSPQFFRDRAEEFRTDIVETPSQSFDNPIFTDETSSFSVLAMFATNPDAIQAGLDAGIDIDETNAKSTTPLMFAASYNIPEIVAAFVEKGADLSATSYYQDYTALHLAAKLNPHPDVVEALVKGGADLEAQTSEGETPLLLAAQHNPNIEVVGRLVDLGADTSVYNPENGQPVGAIVRERAEGYGFERLPEVIMDEVVGKFE